MKTFTIATLAVLASANVFAADTVPLYEGKNIYKTQATLADVLYSETEQQQDIHGNTLAVRHLSNTKVDKDVFIRDQIRQDEKLNEYGNRLDAYEASSNDLSSSLANYKASTDSRLAGLESDIQQAKEGNAVALAVAAQQFCTDVDCGFQTAASASTIHGKQAIAVGMGGAVSENVFLNAAFSKSGKTQGGAVSATYRWK